METLKQVLMSRDDLNEVEALNLIIEAREDMLQRLDRDEMFDPADFMEEWFGLEPDYFDEILYWEA